MVTGYIEVMGSKMYYEDTGAGELIVLLHGGFGTTHDFDAQVPELSRRFRVVAFERPGHGHSPDVSGAFTFDLMAQGAIGFMEAMKLGAANLVGWSDGAITALHVALARPDLVSRLVSVGGSFDTSSLTPALVEWLKSATPDSFAKRQPTLVERYKKFSPDGPGHFPVVFEKTRNLWLTEPNITKEELGKIKAPTLVMAADKDMMPIEHTLDLYHSIPGAELCIVPGATHSLLSERPEVANKLILDFLAKPKPSR